LRSVIGELEQGLIVSCQVVDKEAHRQPGNPMWGPTVMAMLAKAAVLGGACGIRVNGPADTKAVRDAVEVPVIGIHKLDIDGYAVRITPTIESAREIVASGADIVALDATDRPHPEGLSGVEIVRLAKRELSVPIMADVSTCKEGDVVKGRVIRRIKGGFLVDIGVPVFLPASQVDIRKPGDISRFIGQEVRCKILKIDVEGRNIVVSRRKLIEEERRSSKEKILAEIDELKRQGRSHELALPAIDMIANMGEPL